MDTIEGVPVNLIVKRFHKDIELQVFDLGETYPDYFDEFHFLICIARTNKIADDVIEQAENNWPVSLANFRLMYWIRVGTIHREKQINKESEFTSEHLTLMNSLSLAWARSQEDNEEYNIKALSAAEKTLDGELFPPRGSTIGDLILCLGRATNKIYVGWFAISPKQFTRVRISQ
jgi:hypothetical protein